MKPPRQKRRRSKSRAAAHKAIPDQLFIPLEQKLIRLALDDAAAPGEVLNASVSLIKSLRKRGVRPEALLQPAANGVTRSAPRQAPDYGSTILSFGKFRGFRIREVDLIICAGCSAIANSVAPPSVRRFNAFWPPKATRKERQDESSYDDKGMGRRFDYRP
jgi:hypothetical protein